MLHQIHDAAFKALKLSLHLVLKTPITVSIIQKFSWNNSDKIYHPCKVQRPWKTNTQSLYIQGKKLTLQMFISKTIWWKLTFKCPYQNSTKPCFLARCVGVDNMAGKTNMWTHKERISVHLNRYAAAWVSTLLLLTAILNMYETKSPPMVQKNRKAFAYTQNMNKGDRSQHHILGMILHVPA